MNDTCLTITRVSRAELRVQGSRFIATAAPAATVEAAMALLEDVRNEFHDCTHTCFAYRIGPNGEHHRSSDGREPSGSAGKPIMRAIEHRGLTDLVVTVTRYFGILNEIARPSYSSYMLKAADLEGARRALLATIELRNGKTGRDSVPVALQRIALTNPYTNEPFKWDEATGSVVFEGVGGSDDNRKRYSFVY